MIDASEERHVGLIVEDDLEIAAELKELFRIFGFDHLHAETADEAMPLIDAGAFDFALLDMQIKENERSLRARVETGAALMQYVRKRYPRRNDDDKHIMQIIAMSGHAKERSEAVKLMQHGANDFFAKPFADNKEPLDVVIRRCLRMSGRTDHAGCAALNEAARAGAATRSSAPPAGAAAMLFSHEHDGMPLTAGDAKAFVERRREYDLFLNVAAPTGSGYLAGATDAKGKFADVTLTQMEAAVLAEIVLERKAVRAVALKCVRQGGIASPVRIIEKARGLVDVKKGRTSWRAFRTITHVGGDDTNKEFLFDPPAGFRWAVLQAAGS